MRWILLDLVVALSALVVLAVLVLGLWRKVKALGATVREAGERVERATDALTTAQLGVDPAYGQLEDRAAARLGSSPVPGDGPAGPPGAHRRRR